MKLRNIVIDREIKVYYGTLIVVLLHVDVPDVLVKYHLFGTRTPMVSLYASRGRLSRLHR